MDWNLHSSDTELHQHTEPWFPTWDFMFSMARNYQRKLTALWVSWPAVLFQPPLLYASKWLCWFVWNESAIKHRHLYYPLTNAHLESTRSHTLTNILTLLSSKLGSIWLESTVLIVHYNTSWKYFCVRENWNKYFFLYHLPTRETRYYIPFYHITFTKKNIITLDFWCNV